MTNHTNSGRASNAGRNAEARPAKSNGKGGKRGGGFWDVLKD